MSDDKLRDLTPIDISFTPGERPTDEKLEGMMQQVADGLEFIENTIGDAFGYSLQTENVWTSNLARDIGDRDKISPVLHPGKNISNYNQTLTLGKLEHELDLIPIGTGAGMITSSSDTSIVPAQFKLTPDLLEEPGDWTIDGGILEKGIQKNSRKLVTHAPSSGGSVIFGEVTSGRGSSFEGASLNVIPSVAQAIAGGDLLEVTLSDSIENIYTIALPLETHVTNEIYENENATLSNTKSSVQGSTQLEMPNFFYDTSGLDLASDDLFSGEGKVYPLNLVKIYDYTQSKIVEGLLQVKAPDSVGERRHKVLCKFRSDITLTEGTNQYLMVVAGTSISDAIGALQRDLYFHTHNGNDMIRNLDHKSLMNLRTSTADISNRSRYYGPSSIDNNDHSMYFHRDGFTNSDIGSGGNIVRGDIVIGSLETGLSTEHENNNLNTDSNKVRFGHHNNGPAIGFEKVVTHNIPEGNDTIPQSFSDTALVIEGSLDDTTQLIKTTKVEGNLRVSGQTILGTSEADDTAITGELFLRKSLVLSPKSGTALESQKDGALVFDKSVNRLKVYSNDASSWIGIPRETEGAKIGDIKTSVLTEAQFQTIYDSNWVLCDGRSIVGSDLFILTGMTTAPDLGGKFLRGEGGSSSTLNSTQGDSTKMANSSFAVDSGGSHGHTISGGGTHTHSGTTGTTGSNHDHRIYTRALGGAPGYPQYIMGDPNPYPTNELNTFQTQNDGTHTHNISIGSSGSHSHTVENGGAHTHTVSGGDSETRPVNYTVNFFIKINNRVW